MRNAVKILVGVGILLAPVVYAQTTTTYTYDNLGRLKTVSSASAYATTYSYDSADNRTSMQTVASSSSSSSSGTNHAPVCGNSTIIMSGLPSYAAAQPSVSSGQILALCTDADGDTMTVTSPTPLPYSQNLPVGQNSVAFPFTVSDGRGGTGSGTITYQRP